METDLTRGVKEKYDKLIAEGLVPQRRWGQPEDVGLAVGAIRDGRTSHTPQERSFTSTGVSICGGCKIAVCCESGDGE